jgi:EAL domain-containing protein (putative c-di-GMP-specific phosphodiesterase class I)
MSRSRAPAFAVNLSGQSLSGERSLHFLIDMLDTLSIPTEQLYFEITGTAAIVNLKLATRLISILKGILPGAWRRL